jgi:hypothetical protein
MEQRNHERIKITDKNIRAKMAFANFMDILDISRSGMAFEVDRRLNIDREYSVEIEWNGNALLMRGRIVWAVLKKWESDVKGNTIPIYRAGMSFTHIPEIFEKEIKLMECKKQDVTTNEGNEYISLSIDALEFKSNEKKYLEEIISSL